ncbi:MAG: MBL fold metallo-hydrolase [Oceanococcus sp.]
MQFAILGSGSKGNASVICGAKSRVMVDCGFSRKETEARLARIGLQASDIDAVLVTHEHSDHVSGVARFTRPNGIPVYATHGTAAAAKLEDLDNLHLFSPHQSFDVGDLQIQPYPVPHDAREPVQFVISHQTFRIGILSDAGAVTPHMQEILSGCDALLLECNHCPELLENGPYPASLKQRVASRLGHLSNHQSAALLNQLDRSRLQHLAVTHISEKNNCPIRATQALVDVLGENPDWLAIAHQDEGLSWRQLEL